MILAQIQNTDPVHLRDFLIIGGFLLSSVASVMALMGQKRTQKREISFSEEFVTGKECGQKHSEIERRVGNIEQQLVQIRTEMKADRIALDASDESRASRIHARLDALENDINKKIQELPDRVIAFLNNTRVIK
jgi:hypothetical protein